MCDYHFLLCTRRADLRGHRVSQLDVTRVLILAAVEAKTRQRRDENGTGRVQACEFFCSCDLYLGPIMYLLDMMTLQFFMQIYKQELFVLFFIGWTVQIFLVRTQRLLNQPVSGHSGLNFLQIHLEKLPSDLFSANQNITGPVGIL